MMRALLGKARATHIFEECSAFSTENKSKTLPPASSQPIVSPVLCGNPFVEYEFLRVDCTEIRPLRHKVAD